MIQGFTPASKKLFSDDVNTVLPAVNTNVNTSVNTNSHTVSTNVSTNSKCVNTRHGCYRSPTYMRDYMRRRRAKTNEQSMLKSNSNSEAPTYPPLS